MPLQTLHSTFYNIILIKKFKKESHKNGINRTGDRHSLRALKHRPCCLAWPEGPASVK